MIADDGGDSPEGLIRRQERLAAGRAPFEAQWQELADYVRPLRADFRGEAEVQGGRRGTRIFDGTAGRAADGFAGGLYALLTNPATTWFTLETGDEALDDRPDVRLWLDDTARRVRAALAARGGRFYNRVSELYADLGTFGTGIFYIDERRDGRGLHVSCRPLSECFVAENAEEEVDTVFRRFTLSARQALDLWGDRVGRAVARAAAERPEQRFPFLHAVWPNPEARAGRLGPAGMAWTSQHVDITARATLSVGGYHENPYQVARWDKAGGEAYGRSPGMTALADIKMLNRMAETTIKAAQKAADPPLLAPDDGAIGVLRTYPGGITYGAIDPSGRQLVQPLATGARLDIGLDMQEQRRQAILETFQFSLMQMVAQPNMTATEVLARQEERLRLLGPNLGRVQSEFLDPAIARVLGLMTRAGALAPPPEALGARGIRVAYVSPLARAQRASEGQAIARTLESLMQLGQALPEVLDNLDGDALARALADSFGMPARALRSREAVAALRERRVLAALMPGTGGAP
jgi:hypothetical protein